MVDFTQAIAVGIGAANAAAKNLAEIDSVFADLNDQLYKVTGRSIELRPMPFQEKFNVFSKPEQMFVRKSYMAIGIISSSLPPKEIARWEVSPSGYPCTISFESGTSICSDKKGLENALADLLREPFVGQEITRRMQDPMPAADGKAE